MKTRDIKTDDQTISNYWEMDVIEDGDDIAEILTIAEYWMEQHKKHRIELLNHLPCIYHEGGDSLCHYIEVTEEAKRVLILAGKDDGWIEFNSLPGEKGPEMDITGLAFELGATRHDGEKFIVD